MRLRVELLGMNLQTDEAEGHSHSEHTPSDTLADVEVKAKTKWAYVSLRLPMTRSSTPTTLPSFFPSSFEEPLVLFIEVWKSGHFQGLSEFNIRELLGKKPGEDVVKVG